MIRGTLLALGFFIALLMVLAHLGDISLAIAQTRSLNLAKVELLVRAELADIPDACDLEAHEVKMTITTFTVGDDGETYPRAVAVIDCGGGAYNTSNRIFLIDDDYTVFEQTFITPQIDNTTSGENDEVVDGFTVSSWRTTGALSNADFDKDTQAITFFNRTRGVGDEGIGGTYQFDAASDDFELLAYQIRRNVDGVTKTVDIVPSTHTLP